MGVSCCFSLSTERPLLPALHARICQARSRVPKTADSSHREKPVSKKYIQTFSAGELPPFPPQPSPFRGAIWDFKPTPAASVRAEPDKKARGLGNSIKSYRASGRKGPCVTSLGPPCSPGAGARAAGTSTSPTPSPRLRGCGGWRRVLRLLARFPQLGFTA